jgi:3-isopropylmalate/(R)-2-methylmalate dehydratase small subunit
MSVQRRVWRVGENIDTDALAPGHAMKLGIDGIKPFCLEGVRPDFAAGVRAGDVLVAGANFGIGSSREQAAAVLVALGVYAVIAPSYNGLYFRNAFNVGLLLLTCAHATKLGEGERVVIDEHAQPWTVQGTDAPALPCEPVPDFLLQRVRMGGLLNELKHRLARKATDDA